MDDGIKKLWYVCVCVCVCIYIYVCIYLQQMDLEDIMLSEVSQTEEDKYHMSFYVES